ncbi:ABC transporter permease [Aureibaculum conchae]|uniref:ABC transporter permease n=1 Tax=Aureibaculum sp. 2308TA14-22 TaxID=3108392 RepID=UPI0033942874
MLKNYLKIAWRNLKKQPFFTFLNTFGLAIGIAGGLLISLYIYHEFSFDKMFTDSDRIHRINVDIKFGGEVSNLGEVSAPMAATMKKDFSQIESTTRFRDLGSMLLRRSDVKKNVKESQTTYVDHSFFEMFGIELLFGDTKTALTKPNTVILTKTAAEKHFGLNDAVGQTLLLDNDDIYTVDGIIDDLPKNSFLRDYSVFVAMAGYDDAQDNEWTSHNYYTFIKLIPSADINDLQAPLQSMLGTYIIPFAQKYFPGITVAEFKASGNYLNFSTVPLTDIHLYSNRENEMSANNSMQNLYILSFIGLFLILLASVNFMNLSTAHSLKRAKEVGIRKTLGSNKRDLVHQFLTESGLVSLLSLLLGIGLAYLALPFFNGLSGKEISIPFLNPIFWILLFTATGLLTLLSGSYPAFFMSQFIPVKVLKGTDTGKVGGGNIRNSLVVFQFAISVFLIISTLVVFQQLDYIQNKDLGFKKDQVLLIEDVYSAGNQVKVLKEEIKQLGQVENVTLSGFLPIPSSRNNTTFYKDGIADQDHAINMQTWRVDFDYINTLNMEILVGRDFDEQMRADSTAIILNESAVATFGSTPKEILGARLSRDLESENPTFYTVIGIIKNFNFESLKNDIGALSLTIGDSYGAMAIKLNSGDFTKTLSNIEAKWNKVAPGQLFSYYFMDDSFNETYKEEKRLGSIFITFTILSLLIACLGLFGLAAFNAQKRTKEIGVRKVLGASVSQITYKLTVDFLKLVGIAVLISIPLGWYAMNRWLQDFAFRIEISWWIFALAGILAVAIAILTVSYQSIKAAIVNPVKSLKTE